jgi:putative hydrolase of the HAD superfamily
MNFLLFDLGGVLVKFDGYKSIVKWTGASYSESVFWEKWLCSETVKLFESGKLDENTFASRIIGEFHIDITPSEFISDFDTWPSGFYDGTQDFLLKLRDRYSLGCLSNTNPIHLKRITERWNIPEYFDYSFFSHELGCVKPDREIFERVLEKVPFDADSIVFFDDNPLNVKAAESLDIKSFCVRGFAELKKVMAEEGLI